MHVILISVLFFFTLVFFSLGLYYHWTRGQRSIEERLKKYSRSFLKPGSKEEKEASQGPGLGLKSAFTAAGKVFAGKSVTKELAGQLARADLPLRAEEFLLIWTGAAIVPGTLISILTGKALTGLAFYLLGIIIPPMLINAAQEKRLKKFNQQISDSLSIMANSLRAGYSFMQAMELVSKEMPNPIGKEFARTFREVNLGTPLEEALLGLTKRVKSDDLDLLVTAVLIQRQVGGNLAEVLDNISHTIRERIRIHGEIKTLTAQGKISGLVIGLLPPILVGVLMILNPDYILPLFKSPLGWALLLGGLISELVGVLLIKKIITIDY